MNNKLFKTMIAGKLAVSANVVSAGGLGKTDVPDSTTPQLTLGEVGAPYNIITAPADAATSVTGSEITQGTIYTQLAANQRIDFVLSGIDRSQPLAVFLAFSKGAGAGDLWQAFPEGRGQLELEPETLEIMTALYMEPDDGFNGLEEVPTSLGMVEKVHESMVVPFRLGDLTTLGEEGDVLYFQAISIAIGPEGEFLWDQVQASEVDAFALNTSSATNTDLGSKSGDSTDSGSDGSSDGSDSGSKL